MSDDILDNVNESKCTPSYFPPTLFSLAYRPILIQVQNSNKSNKKDNNIIFGVEKKSLKQMRIFLVE